MKRTLQKMTLSAAFLMPAFAYAEPTAPPYKITRTNGEQVSLTGALAISSRDDQPQVIDEKYLQENFSGHELAIYAGFQRCLAFCEPARKSVNAALENFNVDETRYKIILFNVTNENLETCKKWADSFGNSSIETIVITGSDQYPGTKAAKERIIRDLHLMIMNERGHLIHKPEITFIDAKGTFEGSVLPIDRNRTPAPENVSLALQHYWGLQPVLKVKSEPQPR